MEQKEQAGAELFGETFECFKANLRLGMLLADEDEYGEPRRVTQGIFAKLAGVGRSTLSKYLGKKDQSANPDLRTICAIADALAVPPAYLLMRPRDWKRLRQAAYTMEGVSKKSKLRELSRVFADKTKSRDQLARLATVIEFAEMLDVPTAPLNAPVVEAGTAPGYTDLYKRTRRAIRFGGSIPAIVTAAEEANSGEADLICVTQLLTIAITMLSLADEEGSLQ